jgi:hypothetical protein
MTLSAVEWRRLMASLPSVDDEFVRDVKRSRHEFGPPTSPWEDD